MTLSEHMAIVAEKWIEAFRHLKEKIMQVWNELKEIAFPAYVEDKKKTQVHPRNRYSFSSIRKIEAVKQPTKPKTRAIRARSTC